MGMVMMDEDQYDEMEADLRYWAAATAMLSEILVENGISFEVTEDTVRAYLEDI